MPLPIGVSWFSPTLPVYVFAGALPGPTAIIKTVGDSNIVIIFMAWIDQTQSDFGKMRSLAIKVAKDALEQGGFTLPEPLYRLTIDDRSGPPGSSTADSGAGTSPAAAEKRREKSASTVPADADLDLSPDTHIEAMVNDERSQSADTDLLDSTRPAE